MSGSRSEATNTLVSVSVKADGEPKLSKSVGGGLSRACACVCVGGLEWAKGGVDLTKKPVH